MNVSALEEIRTPDLWLRRPTLYPLGYKRNVKIIAYDIIPTNFIEKELDTSKMAVYNPTPHHTTLLPEYRVTILNNLSTDIDAKELARMMYLRDKELTDRLVIDDENPDYIIASETCFWHLEDNLRLKDYFLRRKDSIFIFRCHECIDPDLNLFDYALVWNPDFVCGDRVAHIVPYIGVKSTRTVISDITYEEARSKLDSKPGFCNFIYSHASEPRDTFFRLLSQYKHVDSLGPHMNNTDAPTSRDSQDWYALSIKMKTGYKFSIAMENSSYKGYTTEKIVSSLHAHTVPIYWGDPAVTDFINPKAFINCNDYSSFDEVIERVKEIDSNDELWLDMVTQPWQTEEQYDKVVRMLDDNDAFIRNIFTQDIKKAKRRPVGAWPDKFINHFTGILGTLNPRRIKFIRSIRKMIDKLIPKKRKSAVKEFVKKFLHMN